MKKIIILFYLITSFEAFALEDNQIKCILNASMEFGIAADILLAVAEQEGGKPFQYKYNKNNTYDIGTMQFNSAYIDELQNKYYIDTKALEGDGCYPYRLAAWRIKEHILNDKGDILNRIANYHSKTHKHNIKYSEGIRIRAKKWTEIIKTDDFKIKYLGDL